MWVVGGAWTSKRTWQIAELVAAARHLQLAGFTKTRSFPVSHTQPLMFIGLERNIQPEEEFCLFLLAIAMTNGH